MLWIAIHLPQLSLQAWLSGSGSGVGPGQVQGRGAADRPRALLHAHRVVQVDEAAAAAGVQPGQRRATALALAPDLCLGTACVRRDLRLLRAVAHVALGFSPSVCWATPDGPQVADAAFLADPRHLTDLADLADAPEPANLADSADPAEPTPATADAPLQPAPGPALVGVRLEVSTCLRLFGGLPALLQRLCAGLRGLGLHQVQLACAPTELGAALLAAMAVPVALTEPTEARRRAPADAAGRPWHAVLQLRSLAALQPWLDRVPLPLLGLSPGQQAAAQALGLQRLGDLHALPREGLARRLGPALLERIDQARGHRPGAWCWLQLPARFEDRLTLDWRADDTAALAVPARHLLARLLAWAGARQGCVVRCQLRLHHEPRHRADAAVPAHTDLVLAPARPRQVEPAHLGRLLDERLGRLVLPAAVQGLSLVCDALLPREDDGPDLFTGLADAGRWQPPQARRAGLAALVERLQARLGAQQVQSVHAVADRRPERGTRWCSADPAAPVGLAGCAVGHPSAPSPPSPPSPSSPSSPRRVPAHGLATGAAAGSGSDRAATATGIAAAAPSAVSAATRTIATAAPAPDDAGHPRPASAQRLPAQPLWLLPQPLRLGEGPQGPLWQGRPLELLAGPERLETGWWDAPEPTLRDYFIARDGEGALAWIFLQRPAARAAPHWCLQGWFA